MDTLINNDYANARKHKYTFYLISIITLAIYTTITIIFVWHDGLSSFASDSANYMLMGLYLSPWIDESFAILSLWPYQDFPPFFPLVLAATGAAHNMIAAHILTLAFLIISLPLICIFTKQCFATNWQALVITSIFAISPSVWMNTLGILSENLYLLISLLILILFSKLETKNIIFSCFFGLLLAVLILTRTIGLSMLVAYIIVGFNLYRKEKLDIKQFTIPIIITVVINLVAGILHHSSIPSQYIDQFNKLAFGEQFIALIDAWFSSWQFYWVDTLILPYSVILLLGLLACLGLFVRLRTFKLDAVYVLVYLFIILIWPHPGQALRFIYPIQVLLLINAFFFIHYLFNKFTNIPSYKPITLLLLLVLAVVTPSLSYSFNRYKTGKENGYHHITEFYRVPDLKKAKINAAIQTTMFKDMEHIRNNTNKNDLILYFSPTYIALLANRKSTNITFSYSDKKSHTVDNIADADYIYLSRLHPRKTGEDINGLLIQDYFDGNTEKLWTHYSAENKEPISVFLKIRK